MSDRGGRRGGRGFQGRLTQVNFHELSFFTGRGGDRGRGPGRGRGRGDFTPINEEDGRRRIRAVTDQFQIGPPKRSDNIDAPETPNYPRGRIGIQATCLANYFRVDHEQKEAFHYRVEIDVDFDQIRSLLIRLADNHDWGKDWIYDGRYDLYSSRRLPITDSAEYEMPIQRGKRDIQAKIKIQHTSVVQLGSLKDYIGGTSREYPAEAVRVLEIALSHAVSLIPDVVLHRKNVFSSTDRNNRSIGFGAEVFMGYHQSIKPCQGGLFANMDAACGAFHKAMPVHEFIKEILNLDRVPRTLNPHQIQTVKSVLKGLFIRTVRGDRKMKVLKLTGTPRELTFHHKAQDREISVLDYYENTDQRLKHPELPCLDCSRGKNACYLPPECATIAPAQFIRKITEKHQEAMIKISTQKPQEKQSYLSSVVSDNERKNTVRNSSSFQITFPNNDMVDIRARVLPPPLLAYKEPSCVSIGAEGQWNLSTGNVRFFKGKKLRSWALVSLLDQRDIDNTSENSIGKFVADLSDAIKSLMIAPSNVEVNRIPIIYAQQSSNFIATLEQAKDRAKQVYDGRDPDVILVLFPRSNTRLYQQVKHASDQVVGIPTQCFLADKAGVGGRRPPRGRPQYCTNLAMKINVKVGGSNWALLRTECGLPMLHQQKPYMVLGGDVSHPAQRSSLPSIAAVVGSIDPMATRYCTRVTNQPAREEIILDMKQSVKALINEFKSHNNGHLPGSIIMFRDGVSEGFFAKVVQSEYKAIVEACLETEGFSAQSRPPITFINIQKRHHTRLFPKSQCNHFTGNVMPGTVVDSVITSPFGLDFFLCSQAGIQGTVRPAHYHVLVDENNLGADAIQIMCYWMCYMSCRCTKAISVPAPAVYAHLAAMRGRILAGEESDDDSSLLGGAGGSTASGDVSVALENIGNRMYYV
eukprot:g3401.t1